MRDVGAVVALTAAVAILVLIGLAGQWSDLLWHGSLGDSEILVASVAVPIGTLLGIALRRSSVLAHATLSLLLTAGTYAAVQGRAYYEETKPGRDARAAAQQWPLLVSENYNNPETFALPPPRQSEFGRDDMALDGGRLVLILSTTRDHTDQVGLNATQPSVGDFYVQADVELVEGPEDSYCAILFGWQDNEHWYAAKIGRSLFEVTRDPGSLPHQRLDGPRAENAVRSGTSNRLAVLSLDGIVEVFVNDRLVSTNHLGQTTGQVWLAAQAANTPDALRCAFDNVVLRAAPA